MAGPRIQEARGPARHRLQGIASHSAPDEELPAHLAHGPTKVLSAVTLHDLDQRRDLASSRLVFLTHADLAKCRSSISYNGTLFCDPHRRAQTGLTRIPPVRPMNHVEKAVDTPISVQLAGWALTVLREQGYRVTPLDSLPEGAESKTQLSDDLDTGVIVQRDAKAGTESGVKADAESDITAPGDTLATETDTTRAEKPILGLKLEKKGVGLITMVQYTTPRILGSFGMVMAMRIGLVEVVSPAAGLADAERGDQAKEDEKGMEKDKGDAPLPQVEWTMRRGMKEGDDSTFGLRDPRTKETTFFFRVMLRYHARDAYTIGFEVLPVSLPSKTAQTEATPSTVAVPPEGVAVGQDELDVGTVDAVRIDQRATDQDATDMEAASRVAVGVGEVGADPEVGTDELDADRVGADVVDQDAVAPSEADSDETLYDGSVIVSTDSERGSVDSDMTLY
ncbi:hypothetical protein VTO73DRAFT_12428 [Trametes versicolor]